VPAFCYAQATSSAVRPTTRTNSEMLLRMHRPKRALLLPVVVGDAKLHRRIHADSVCLCFSFLPFPSLPSLCSIFFPWFLVQFRYPLLMKLFRWGPLSREPSAGAWWPQENWLPRQPVLLLHSSFLVTTPHKKAGLVG